MPFSHCGLCRADRIVESFFPALHLRFRWRADANHCNASRQLRQPFLKFLAIVVRSRVCDQLADLGCAAFDRLLVAATADDCRVVLIDDDALRLTEALDSDFLQLQAKFLRNELAACQNRNILHHGFPAVSEPWRLHGDAGQRLRVAC